MLDRVLKLIPDIAIRVRLSALIPLLSKTSKPDISSRYDQRHVASSRQTHLVAHQAFLALRSASVPFLEVALLALLRAHGRKVEEDGDKPTTVCRLLSSELADHEEFL